MAQFTSLSQLSSHGGALHPRSCVSTSAPVVPSVHRHVALAPPRNIRAAAAPTKTGLYDVMSKVTQIQESIARTPALANCKCVPKRVPSEIGDRVGFMAAGEVSNQGVVLTIPEDEAITSLDAAKQELVGPIAEECSELIALTLWLMAERSLGAKSAYAALISSLPESTMTPLLWDDKLRAELLAGSPVLAEARTREAAIRAQWTQLDEAHFSKDRARFSSAVFSYEFFAKAFSVVLAHALYLPAAQCFALLPVASLMFRTGNDNGCALDYDAEKGAVVVTATRAYKEGQEVLLNDGRPNDELFLATGTFQESNTSNYITFIARLLEADRYFMMKSQILEEAGFTTAQEFPVYADRMPNQLLAYLRLARLQDAALFAKVSFTQDVELSQMNEYEVLQLLMGDCREKLAAYPTSVEEDIKLTQRPELTPVERLAVRFRLQEKRLVSSTMDAVRSRLAPIRGIPTKKGFEDANSDIKEIFDTLEAIPNAPKALIDGFMSWARGEQDPDWGKPAKPDNLPKRPW